MAWRANYLRAVPGQCSVERRVTRRFAKWPPEPSPTQRRAPAGAAIHASAAVRNSLADMQVVVTVMLNAPSEQGSDAADGAPMAVPHAPQPPRSPRRPPGADPYSESAPVARARATDPATAPKYPPRTPRNPAGPSV